LKGDRLAYNVEITTALGLRDLRLAAFFSMKSRKTEITLVAYFGYIYLAKFHNWIRIFHNFTCTASLWLVLPENKQCTWYAHWKLPCRNIASVLNFEVG
jgi:hypothetical protein